ncbi:hypothetical protein ACHAW5_011206 [Stephanodiscus triporus]|uniref:SET domain-containing protein n=1 Tax=Stephanodiscus triporus TaxID=2934178 RepID=A0ABD3PD88_9STRA
MRVFAILYTLVAFAAAFDGSGASNSGEIGSDDNTKFGDLVAWVRRNGGRVDDRLGLKNHQHGEVSIRGGVALLPLDEGSELLFLPWKLVLGTTGENSTVSEDKCSVLQYYASEVEAGPGSFWYPYLALDDSLSSIGRVPSLWNDSVISELQGLPPFLESTSGLTGWFSSNCVDGVPFSSLPRSNRQALLAAITRAAGMRFLPIYDLLNHHNGMLNTQSKADVKGVTITITRNVTEGQELFMSYRGGKDSTASDTFRRYGFVESWPQHWKLIDDKDGSDASGGMQFLLLPDKVVTIFPTDSILSQIGAPGLQLSDFLASTHNHNQMISVERLIGFSRFGQDLMSSLATTTKEDNVILRNLRLNLSQQNLNSIKSEQLRDLMSAVDYRMQFKESIQMAIDAAEKVLTLIIGHGVKCIQNVEGAGDNK